MWKLPPTLEIPNWMITEIRRHAPQVDGRYAAQLLLSRGIQSPQKLQGFLNPDDYLPSSPFAFGQEMNWAIERIKLARKRHEKVIIWGDFDADGVTATAVLWEGLRQFLPQSNIDDSSLSYYIPNRLTESHGLNCSGIDRLNEQGCTLIITCDTGSTNLAEIEQANRLGIDIIVTDHHTLPPERPPVIAIINPRNFPLEHPLYHLSGVAVAYKLIEALYETLPEVPQQPLETLLDLVAIGLIADLVQLTGDCRYLAQRGIQQLQKQLQNSTRPGVAKLLKLCKTTGDRPTDISFGLGPRINAVSRIQGDAHFCVELLTSRDIKHCEKLAFETELANTRRKVLQKDVAKDVAKKLANQDLSTTAVIVLSDPQWPTGILGLVASQVAQEYQKPTILLTEDHTHQLARGSARSVQHIDLYELVQTQSHLLEKFGGHPFAAGLSLKLDNLPLFIEGINRQLRQQIEFNNIDNQTPSLQPDLCCTIAELGHDLFQELKLLEPCGMGNPTPKILIQNCSFTHLWNKNQQDLRGRKIQYIKTGFTIYDDSDASGFPGVWWGHYRDELQEDKTYDAVVELDFNTYDKQYEVRLIDVTLQEDSLVESTVTLNLNSVEILDWRSVPNSEKIKDQSLIVIEDCPTSWQELKIWCRRAFLEDQKLAIAYPPPPEFNPVETWEKLIGIAKYVSRTHQPISRQQLLRKLQIGEIPLKLGFEGLQQLGFKIEYRDRAFHFDWQERDNHQPDSHDYSAIQAFINAVQEEQFMRQYFSEVPVDTISRIANHHSIQLSDQI
jgi:single-stranded-DNA-specific exonuclease